jgi:hypothetical protein
MIVLVLFSNIVFGAAFTPGNVVVVRVGDGTSSLNNAAQPVFLDEYSLTTGQLVQSVALSTTASGSNRPFTISGSATSEGALTLSPNRQFLSLAGYDATVGTASVSSATGIDRVIALVNSSGTVNTTTGISAGSAYTTNNFRGAVTKDGTGFWCAGAGSSNSGGTWYVPFGSITASPIQVTTSQPNTRTINIFNNQLYTSSASGTFYGIAEIGIGTPTVNGNFASLLPGFSSSSGPSNYGFVLLDLNPNIPGVDVAYICDDRNTSDGGIYKYSLVNNTWVQNGFIADTNGYRGLTATVVCGNVSLIASAGARISVTQDNSGYNQTVTSTLTTLVQAPSGTRFRGIAFSPLTQDTLPLDASVLSTTNARCFNAANGAINIQTTGGSGNFTYLWSNGSTSRNLTNLTSGNYTLTVNDVLFGCRDTVQVQINQPSAITVTPSTTPVNCFGGNNGSIQLNVSGGNGNYSYLWNDNSTQPNRNNIAGGNYTVTVSDINQCTASANVTVAQPAAINISATTINTSCNGGNTGSIALNVTGGTGTYTYLWNDNSTLSGLQNLSAGSYSVTVTDASQCTASSSLQIFASGTLAITDSVTNVRCSGDANGSISVSVSGGTPNYSFLWSNVATTNAINNLSAGTYSFTVTDNDGCQIGRTYILTQPDAITATASSTAALCNGSNTGNINLNANGGTGTLSFRWNDNVTSQNRSNVPAGPYSVTVTDGNNCTISASVSVSQPTAIQINLTSTDASPQTANDGAITATISGGTPSYTFTWSNNQTSQNVSGLQPGNYCLTVTDANSCSVSSCSDVDILNGIEDNKCTDKIVIKTAANQLYVFAESGFPSNANIIIVDLNGRLVYTQSSFANATKELSIDISTFASGFYILNIQNGTEFKSVKFTINK